MNRHLLKCYSDTSDSKSYSYSSENKYPVISSETFNSETENIDKEYR